MISFRGVCYSLSAIVLAVVFSPAPNARAIEGESITLSPASKKYAIEANQVIQDTMLVLNDGTVPYDIIVYAAPYSVQNDTYSPDYTSIKPRSDVYKWVQFSQTKWHLEPGQSVKVPYTLRVPSNVSPGGHYGVLFAETQPSSGPETLSRKKRVGAIVYSSLKGTAVEAGKTSQITLGMLQFAPPLTATISVENSGNVDFVMSERMTVTDVFGHTKYDSGDVEHIIFPNSQRDVAVKWQDTPWAGLYKVHVNSTVLGKTTSKDGYVLVAPRWLLVLIATALVISVAGVIQRRKR